MVFKFGWRDTRYRTGSYAQEKYSGTIQADRLKERSEVSMKG